MSFLENKYSTSFTCFSISLHIATIFINTRQIGNWHVILCSYYYTYILLQTYFHLNVFINTFLQQIELKKSTEALFNDTQENRFTPTLPNIAMVSPGSGFLNLLRYGMLALKLLPNSNFYSKYLKYFALI